MDTLQRLQQVILQQEVLNLEDIRRLRLVCKTLESFIDRNRCTFRVSYSISEQAGIKTIANRVYSLAYSLHKFDVDLSTFSSLHSISLVYTDVTDEALLLLPPSIRSLDLWYCSNISDQGLINIHQRCGDLITSLSLNSTGIEFVSSLSCISSSLTRLNITDSKIAEGMKDLRCTNLLYMSLSTSNHLLDEHIKYIPRSLVELDLSGSPHLQGTSYSDLPSGLTRLLLNDTTSKGRMDLPNTLYELELNRVAGLSNDAISSPFPSLITDLKIDLAYDITPAALSQLPRSIKKLDLSLLFSETDPGLRYTTNDDIEALPSDLEKLVTADAVTADNFWLLTQLTHLEIGTLQTDLIKRDNPFPSTLTYLQLNIGYFNWPNFYMDQIPVNLVTLSLNQCVDDFNASLLPKTLKNLFINFSKQMDSFDFTACSAPLELLELRILYRSGLHFESLKDLRLKKLYISFQRGYDDRRKRDKVGATFISSLFSIPVSDVLEINGYKLKISKDLLPLMIPKVPEVKVIIDNTSLDQKVIVKYLPSNSNFDWKGRTKDTPKDKKTCITM